jgi:hypothetical protein
MTDFLNVECLTITNRQEFGICDGADHNMAFLDFDNNTAWICQVVNSQMTGIEFRAIDFCIEAVRADGNMESNCDCMLTYPDNIVFIELKNKVQDWREAGMKQLESTILQFASNHDLKAFRHKRAFVANRRHPNFHVIDVSDRRRFFDKYRVRLNIEAKIEI